jgi:hypothetical protein
VSVWNAKPFQNKTIDDDDDYDNSSGHEKELVEKNIAQKKVFEENVAQKKEVVSIKKIKWLAPQQSSVDGCLFVLLGFNNNQNIY